MNPLLYIPSVWSPSSFLHAPLFSTVLQHFINSTQSTREHEGRGNSRIGTAGFLDSIMSQREARNHKKRDCLFSTANNSRPEKKAQPCWLRKKAAVGFWIYFTLLDGSCLKILWGSRAQRKPCFKAYHCTQGAYENFINMNPCYPVQSTPADLLT